MKLQTWRNINLFGSSKETKVNKKLSFILSVLAMMELIILLQNTHTKKAMIMMTILISMVMNGINARLGT